MAYTTVSVPRSLADLVDQYVSDEALGFRSRAELVTYALRQYLERLDQSPAGVTA